MSEFAGSSGSIHSLSSEHFEAVVQMSVEVAFSKAWTREKLELEFAEALSLGCFMPELAAFIFYRDLGEVLEVSWLATHVNWQRRGLMMGLFRALADASSRGKSGPREIWLEVHENNHDARNLYEKIGFQVTSRRPRYYSDGGAALLMSWRLT